MPRHCSARMLATPCSFALHVSACHAYTESEPEPHRSACAVRAAAQPAPWHVMLSTGTGQKSGRRPAGPTTARCGNCRGGLQSHGRFCADPGLSGDSFTPACLLLRTACRVCLLTSGTPTAVRDRSKATPTHNTRSAGTGASHGPLATTTGLHGTRGLRLLTRERWE